MSRVYASGLVLFLASICTVAQQAPAGWTSKVSGTVRTFIPPGLQQGEMFQIVVSGRMPLTASIEDWLTNYANVDLVNYNAPTEPKAKAANANIAQVTRTFKNQQGVEFVSAYIAVSLDRDNVRLVQILSNSADAFKRYGPAMTGLVTDLLAEEKQAAKADGRGVDIDRRPPEIASFTPGGDLVPGIYQGNRVSSNDNKILIRFKIILYPSGEYRVLNLESGKEINNGEFQYDKRTGRLDFRFGGGGLSLANSTIDDDEIFLHGKDGDNQPALYSRTDRGLSVWTCRLRFIGPADRLSPNEERAAAAAAEAEAKRFKYVTAPGKGVQATEIAGVIHHSVHHTSVAIGGGLGVRAEEFLYLALKDGTIHDGLAVPPDELDVALSRRREPEKWGKWRRVAGNRVEVAWSVNPNTWTPLEGDWVVQAKASEVLVGRFGTGSSSGAGTVMSYSLWGVTFTGDGRFETDQRGGSGTTLFTETMSGTSIQSQHDDEGSITSVSTPSAIGHVSNRKKNNVRTGRYQITPWAMTATFDNGKVVRMPFFFLDEKRDTLWWDGSSLTK